MYKFFLLLALLVSGVANADATNCRTDKASASMFTLNSPDDRLLLIRDIPHSIASSSALYILNSSCKKTFLGEFIDSPISIFYFTDSLDIFGSLWSSGTALVFRVFSEKTNKMILEAYSKSPPRIFWLFNTQEYPVFYINNCNTCSRFGFYIMGKNGYYHKATKQETDKIKKEIIKDVMNFK